MSERSKFDEFLNDPLNELICIQNYKRKVSESDTILTGEDRARLLMEVSQTSDLVGIGRIVERQLGLHGLIETVLDTGSWAGWSISVHNAEVGETVFDIFQRTNLEVVVGNTQTVGLQYIRDRHSREDRAIQFNVNGNTCEDYDDKIMPAFHVNTIFSTSDAIVVEGFEYDGGALEPLDECNQLMQIRFRLQRTGDTIDVEESYLVNPTEVLHNILNQYPDDIVIASLKQNDQSDTSLAEVLLKQGIDNVVAFSLLHSDDDQFDSEKIERLVTEHPYGHEIIARFLLPYCDAPSRSGIEY